MTDSERLKKKIQDSGLLRVAILRKLGIKSYATLRAKVDGESEFTVSEIDKLCKMLDIGRSEREAIFFAQGAE